MAIFKRNLKLVFFGLVPLVAASAISAQSLSVDDLKAKIDAEMNKGNEYAELLNDPDPERGQIAMRVMLESGDPALVKIALEYGLYNPDPLIQASAVEAYFKNAPKIELRIDARGVDAKYVTKRVEAAYGVGFDDGMQAVAIIPIEKFDAARNCYTAPRFSEKEECYLRISQDQLQFQSTDKIWYQMVWNTAGYLVSQPEINGQTVTVTIPIR